jgi:hypothetical protein
VFASFILSLLMLNLATGQLGKAPRCPLGDSLPDGL